MTARTGRGSGASDDTAEGIRTNEPGTLVYACHRVDGAPRERIFYELYRNRAAFEDHERTEHVQHFLMAREPLLEATTVDHLALTGGKAPAAYEAASRHD